MGLLAVVISAAGLSLVASGAAQAATSPTVQVSMKDYAITPATLTVQVGQKVVWTNDDDAPHTVTGLDGPVMLNSPQMTKGQSFSFIFSKPGVYHYFCAVHPNMKGIINVVASNALPNQSSPVASVAPATAVAPSSSAMPGMAMPVTPTAPAAGGASVDCSGQSLGTEMLRPFITHMDHAHFQESIGQQASDLSNINNYVLIHTVLIENMVDPLFNLAMAAPNGVNPFIVHFDRAHLEESPGQQANDLTNVQNYTKIHTVLIEDMLVPVTGSYTGTYGC